MAPAWSPQPPLSPPGWGSAQHRPAGCRAPEPVFIANTVAAVGLAVPALLAFAVLSAAGARDPAAHLPILRTEILYKLVWIGTMLPHLRQRPRAARLAASFAVMVAGYAAALAEARSGLRPEVR